MYRLTGKRFKFLMLNRLKLKSPDERVPQSTEPGRASPQRAGYGAIYDAVEQRYEAQQMAFRAEGIRDTANAMLGTVKSTGIFLREDGTAGTMQHIDLIV